MKKILIFFLCFLLCACNNETSSFERKKISFDKIFQIDEEMYYIFFYLDGCLACRNIVLYLKEISALIKENIYSVDLLECSFAKKNESNIGVSENEKLYIPYAPYILKIIDGEVKEELAGYQAIRENDNFFSQFS